MTCLNSFDEKEAEESQAVHNVLGLLENILEVPRIRPRLTRARSYSPCVLSSLRMRAELSLYVADAMCLCRSVCAEQTPPSSQLIPTVAEDMFEKTKILRWLLARLRVREFDANKLYASELLSMYLQARASQLSPQDRTRPATAENYTAA